MTASDTNTAPPSQCWDDLNSIYGDCVNMLGENTVLLQTVRSVGDTGDVDRDTTRNALVQRFANDIGRLSRKLSAIQAKHSDRTGGETDPDSFMKSFSIGVEYSEWVEMFNQTILTDVADIQAVCDPNYTVQPRSPGKSVNTRGMMQSLAQVDESPFLPVSQPQGATTVDVMSQIMQASSKARSPKFKTVKAK